MFRNNVMPYLPGIKVSKVLKFFIRSRVLVGKYFIIIQLGVGDANEWPGRYVVYGDIYCTERVSL